MCKFMKRIFMAIRNFVLKLVQQGSGKRTHVTIEQEAGSGVEPSPRGVYTFEKVNESANSVDIRSYKKNLNGDEVSIDWSIGEIEGSGASLVVITKREGGISIIDKAEAEPSINPKKWRVTLTQAESGKTLIVMGETISIRREYTFEKVDRGNNSIDIRSFKKIAGGDKEVNVGWKIGTIGGDGAEHISITKREGGLNIEEKLSSHTTQVKKWHVTLVQDESNKTILLNGEIGGVLDLYEFSAFEESKDLKGYTYLYSIVSKKEKSDVPYEVAITGSGSNLVETKIFKEGSDNYLGINVESNVSDTPKIFKITLTQQGSGKVLKYYKFIESLRMSRGAFFVEELDENVYFVVSRDKLNSYLDFDVDITGEGRDLVTLDFDRSIKGLFKVSHGVNRGEKDLPYVITLIQYTTGKKCEINGVVKKSTDTFTEPDAGNEVVEEPKKRWLGVKLNNDLFAYEGSSPHKIIGQPWKCIINGDRELDMAADSVLRYLVFVGNKDTGGKFLPLQPDDVIHLEVEAGKVVRKSDNKPILLNESEHFEKSFTVGDIQNNPISFVPGDGANLLYDMYRINITITDAKGANVEYELFPFVLKRRNN